MSDDKKYEYEDTPEIEIADNKVGLLVIVIAVVLVSICLYYLVKEFRTPESEKQRANPTAPAAPTPQEAPIKK